MRKILFLTVLALMLTNCKKNRPQSIIDEEVIQDYLDENKLNAIKHNSGLYYIVENPGKKPFPKRNSNVDVIYKGYYTNGDIFDDTKGSAINVNLRNTIMGWQLGIPFFGTEGKGKLIIPSGLAYGRSGPHGNKVLVFDVEIIAVY